MCVRISCKSIELDHFSAEMCGVARHRAHTITSMCIAIAQYECGGHKTQKSTRMEKEAMNKNNSNNLRLFGIKCEFSIIWLVLAELDKIESVVSVAMVCVCICVSVCRAIAHKQLTILICIQIDAATDIKPTIFLSSATRTLRRGTLYSICLSTLRLKLSSI